MNLGFRVPVAFSFPWCKKIGAYPVRCHINVQLLLMLKIKLLTICWPEPTLKLFM